MKTIFFRLCVFLISFLWLACAFAPAGHTAELRDYSLPSEKRIIVNPGTAVQTMNPDENFRIQVKKPSTRQKKQLKNNFSQKLKAAIREDEKAYYTKLIRIIDECTMK